ncbi:MAG: HlyD family efflux transporter periplasmic adaptor subunit [Bacteroidota bacterium]
MNVRQIILSLLAIAVIVGSAFVSRKVSESKAPPNKFSAPAPIKVVDTLTVQNGAIKTFVPIYGKISASEKLDIFAEVGGALVSTSKPFRKGTRFSKGDVLFVIDNQEQRLNLKAQKSNLMNAITQLMPDLKLDYPESFGQWEAYLHEFAVDVPIKEMPEPVNDREKYYISSKNIYSQYYTIRSQEVRLSKYTVIAPFSGIITQTSIHPGTVVRAGQKLGELMNTNSYELEASITISDLQNVKRGMKVNLISEDISGTWEGYIKRISESIDPATQSATLFIGVKSSKIKENMYLKGSINSGSIDDVYELSRDLILDGNQVFVVNDSVLTKTNFEVVRMKEETALVKGLQDGTTLLKKTFPGIFEGMKVQLRKSDNPS